MTSLAERELAEVMRRNRLQWSIDAQQERARAETASRRRKEFATESRNLMQTTARARLEQVLGGDLDAAVAAYDAAYGDSTMTDALRVLRERAAASRGNALVAIIGLPVKR